jgi:hypothetical protein
MHRNLLIAGLGTLVIAGIGIAAASASSGRAAARQQAAGQRFVMQAAADLPSGPVGLKDVKLLNAVTGAGKLSGRVAISSITLAQADGSQAIEVALRAATCDDANGFGAVEDVIVPPNQTVHLTYPAALHLPFVASAPTSWCLYAETVRDDGRLMVSVAGTQL